MDKRKSGLDDFFSRYAENFNAALETGITNADATADYFAACFIEASPLGVNCGKNDAQFKTAIPQGYAFYKKIGITSMEIISKEITILDDFHSMIKINWRSYFTRKNNLKADIGFDVIYFVQNKENEHKIFAYITGDEQKALRENGLIS